jgi:hypothetical protein
MILAEIVVAFGVERGQPAGKCPRIALAGTARGAGLIT